MSITTIGKMQKRSEHLSQWNQREVCILEGSGGTKLQWATNWICIDSALTMSIEMYPEDPRWTKETLILKSGKKTLYFRGLDGGPSNADMQVAITGAQGRAVRGEQRPVHDIPATLRESL